MIAARSRVGLTQGEVAAHHQGQVSAINLPDGRCRFVLSLRKLKI